MYNNFLLHFVQTKKSYPLTKGQVEIAGKSRELSSLYLVPYFEGAIKTISKSHFKLSCQPYGLFIEDLASTNGTEVNGERLSPKKRKRLFHGNTIRIAKNDDFIIEVIDENRGTDVINTGVIKKETDRIPQNCIFFHKDEQTFYVDGKAIHDIPQINFDLLKYLYQNLNKVSTYSDINQDVWGCTAGIGRKEKNTIRAAICKLRQKLNESSEGSGKRYIRASQGYGYKLVSL